MLTSESRRRATAFFLILSVVLLDRAVKQWCVDVLKQVGSIPIIDGVLHLSYAENRGAAFSLLSGQRWPLVAVSAVALALLMALFLSKSYRHRLTDLAFPLMMGGALGNLIDRVAQGYVVDCFDLRFIRFAIFNVADCGITVGGALLALYVILTGREEFLHGRRRAEGEHE